MSGAPSNDHAAQNVFILCMVDVDWKDLCGMWEDRAMDKWKKCKTQTV